MRTNMPTDQNSEETRITPYNAYVNGLCLQYANQLPLSADEIEKYAQDIKPLMAQLVSCIYNLTKYLSYAEIKELYQNLETMDKKDFCLSVYMKYQSTVRDNSTAALNTLFYTLLLRDFYTHDFEKISIGGNFGPVILELTQLCDQNKPYNVLCNFIYFPEDEVPYIIDLGLQILINHCQKAIIPDNFDKNIFAQMVHENLQEIASTMYNIISAKEKREEPRDEAQPPKDKVPLSWIQTHMTPKEEVGSPLSKKVTFVEPPIIQGVTKKKPDPKKTK